MSDHVLPQGFFPGQRVRVRGLEATVVACRHQVCLTPSQVPILLGLGVTCHHDVSDIHFAPGESLPHVEYREPIPLPWLEGKR